ncbi:MAG: hypothetical protein V1758_11665, partial [Pseudomonadota bacterium]
WGTPISRAISDFSERSNITIRMAIARVFEWRTSLKAFPGHFGFLPWAGLLRVQFTVIRRAFREDHPWASPAHSSTRV